ncbi:MAG TPA: hypothetical protein VMU39_16290 [Solirubrobacteraceae bacterium]|nr:hypothetical protein [Solirubrobacteraceae bacterium]
MNHNPEHHSVRRIVLPSGRSIEVVRFHDGAEPAPRGLHVCPQCHSELVQPVNWSEASDNRWELTLECPNCWWCGEGQYDRKEVDRLEEKLDDGLAEMLGDLQRLTQANMAEDIDRFAGALHKDYILPEDF